MSIVSVDEVMPTFTPMLAVAPGPAGLTGLFPLAATPKIDGIRAVVLGGELVSRTLKPIPNVRLREALESALPEGTDGELTHGPDFSSSSSAIMSREGPAGGFTYFAFDFVGAGVTVDSAYVDRVAALRRVMRDATHVRSARAIRDVVEIVILEPTFVRDAAALDAYEEASLEQGHEGIIVRRPDGRYKFGRSTAKEGLMLKVKRFDDAEALVTGVDELVSREAGKAAHSHQLGALVTVRPDGVSFRIGSGFTTEQRRSLWLSRKSLIGKIVKYKFFGIGSNGTSAPRFPTFIGFRDREDM